MGKYDFFFFFSELQHRWRNGTPVALSICAWGSLTTGVWATSSLRAKGSLSEGESACGGTASALAEIAESLPSWKNKKNLIENVAPSFSCCSTTGSGFFKNYYYEFGGKLNSLICGDHTDGVCVKERREGENDKVSMLNWKYLFSILHYVLLVHILYIYCTYIPL